MESVPHARAECMLYGGLPILDSCFDSPLLIPSEPRTLAAELPIVPCGFRIIAVILAGRRT